MIGQGVLRECLLDPEVGRVVTVGRTGTGVKHTKLREVVANNLFDLTSLDAELTGFDACFFCLGVSSSGVSEAEYERLTYTLTMAAAETLARLNPQMTFIYVSGAGTDGSEQGRVMWARVKGRTENALMRLPFKAAYMFRIAAVLPLNGERSRTPLYNFFYALTKPVAPLIRMAFPGYVLSTVQIGRAMIGVARSGAEKRVLESPDIRECARKAGAR